MIVAFGAADSDVVMGGCPTAAAVEGGGVCESASCDLVLAVTDSAAWWLSKYGCVPRRTKPSGDGGFNRGGMDVL